MSNLNHTNVNHQYWEFKYLTHIINLQNIISNSLDELGININPNSQKFFELFSKFLFECSSGEISKYIDDIPTELEEMYMEYTIKRNKD